MFQFAYRRYCRSFKQPLKTAHGLWSEREGLIVQLQDASGHTGYGEIAPLPWFGTETLKEAIAQCEAFDSHLTAEQVEQISDLPASQFGLSSGLRQVLPFQGKGTQRSSNTRRAEPSDQSHILPVEQTAALLPGGAAAIAAWKPLWDAGHRTFKWKIATAPVARELGELEMLIKALPPDAKLRLDANGGLSLTQAEQYLTVCDRLGIEFLEQPLPPQAVAPLQQLSQRYQTPIALDESVATCAAIEHWQDQGWTGLFVVKPAIAGHFVRLLKTCQPCRDRIVVSSVFETAVGRQTVLDFAQALYQDYESPALGMGTDRWFKADGLHQPPFETIWNRLSCHN